MHFAIVLAFLVNVYIVTATADPTPPTPRPSSIDGERFDLQRNLRYVKAWPSERVTSHALLNVTAISEMLCAAECMENRPCAGFSFSSGSRQCNLFKMIRSVAGYTKLPDPSYNTYISVCGNEPGEIAVSNVPLTNAKADAAVVCKDTGNMTRLVLYLVEDNSMILYRQDIKDFSDEAVWVASATPAPKPKSAILCLHETHLMLEYEDDQILSVIWSGPPSNATDPFVKLFISAAGLPSLVTASGLQVGLDEASNGPQ